MQNCPQGGLDQDSWESKWQQRGLLDQLTHSLLGCWPTKTGISQQNSHKFLRYFQHFLFDGLFQETFSVLPFGGSCWPCPDIFPGRKPLNHTQLYQTFLQIIPLLIKRGLPSGKNLDMENHHFQQVGQLISTINGPCSIAMLETGPISWVFESRRSWGPSC